MFGAVKTFKAAHQSSLHLFCLEMYEYQYIGGRLGVVSCPPIHNMNDLKGLHKSHESFSKYISLKILITLRNDTQKIFEGLLRYQIFIGHLFQFPRSTKIKRSLEIKIFQKISKVFNKLTNILQPLKLSIIHL